MARPDIAPTGNERTFGEHELIVTKTDLDGRITYANKVAEKISGFSVGELMGEQHNIVRHPKMPRCIFKLAWDTIQSGNEIFAYVDNLAKNGDHYWVLAHMTPDYDIGGKHVGYHSSRRSVEPEKRAQIESLYSKLIEIEKSHGGKKDGMEASSQHLEALLQEKGVEYREYIFSL
ncbi:MAG: PAS domain-containing protein [Alphaproteobacteria bacterium]